MKKNNFCHSLFIPLRFCGALWLAHDRFKTKEPFLSIMAIDLDTILSTDVITRYPWSVTPAQLMHVYSEQRVNSQGEQIPFDEITAHLASLRTAVEAWYEQETCQKMNTYALGDKIDAVRTQFWRDERFREAFRLLELDYDKDHTKATIPWWNEVAAGELDYREYPDIHGVGLVIGPRHSLETQLMRSGIPRPVKNISVGGIIVTTEPDSIGYAVLGLRGGAAYANTYHINAGALMATEGFKRGLQTVYDIFRQKELLPEFGIADRDVVSAQLGSRIYDHVIDKGPMYVFVVKTHLTKKELHERWKANLDPDKAEHDEPVYISDNPYAVQAFIRENYRGVVVNRKRADHERYLLHPGALALAAYSGMPVSELRTLFTEGNW